MVLAFAYLLAFYSLAGLTWVHFSILGPAYYLPYVALVGVLCFFSSAATPIAWQWPRFERESLAVALVILGPLTLFLLFSWNQEFPLSGDHGHHVEATAKLYPLYRRPVVPLLGALLLGMVFLRRWTPLVMMLGLVTLSYVWPIPDDDAIYYMTRYTPLDRFFAVPWVVVWRLFDLDHGYINTGLRLSHVVAFWLWLLVLRPAFLGRAPNVRVLLYGVMIFWAPSMVYLFSSVYVEAWATVFFLLAVESLFMKEAPRYAPCCWMSLAFLTKELFFLIGPFVWLACALKEERSLRGMGRAFVVGFLVLASFLQYKVVRDFRAGRPMGFGLPEGWMFARGWDHLGFHFGEWMVVLLLMGAAWFVWSRPRERLSFLLLCTGLLALWLVIATDPVSQKWMGFARFNITSFVGLGFVFFLFSQALPPRGVLAGAACLGILNGAHGSTLVQSLWKGDHHRNYFEHSDGALFFPIREFVDQVKGQEGYDGLNEVILRRPEELPFTIKTISLAYRDLEMRHPFRYWQEHQCECPEPGQMLFVLGAFRTELSDTGNEGGAACFEKVRSCGWSYEKRDEGQFVGGIVLPKGAPQGSQ